MEGQKAVTSLTLTDRRERHGVQGGGDCPAAVKRKRGRTFCRLLASVALAKEARYKFY